MSTLEVLQNAEAEFCMKIVQCIQALVFEVWYNFSTNIVFADRWFLQSIKPKLHSLKIWMNFVINLLIKGIFSLRQIFFRI